MIDHSFIHSFVAQEVWENERLLYQRMLEGTARDSPPSAAAVKELVYNVE
jgi:hypothetical protein